MAGRDIVVIGASAGGIRPIQSLLSLLPRDLPASIFVVVHRGEIPRERDCLPLVLSLHSILVAEIARDNARFEHGHVYVAPTDCHLLIERGVMRVERSPRENHCRPSIDALFRSAALAYGRRVASVLLSGMLHDGTVVMMRLV